mmetsp:Transcript_98059/g.184377  ORF Transcript_98059/g.184377 Transcript_98059/m.184377 type:complete len:570 (-) Transcript_98059:308-2017(-)
MSMIGNAPMPVSRRHTLGVMTGAKPSERLVRTPVGTPPVPSHTSGSFTNSRVLTPPTGPPWSPPPLLLGSLHQAAGAPSPVQKAGSCSAQSLTASVKSLTAGKAPAMGPAAAMAASMAAVVYRASSCQDEQARQSSKGSCRSPTGIHMVQSRQQSLPRKDHITTERGVLVQRLPLREKWHIDPVPMEQAGLANYALEIRKGNRDQVEVRTLQDQRANSQLTLRSLTEKLELQAHSDAARVRAVSMPSLWPTTRQSRFVRQSSKENAKVRSSSQQRQSSRERCQHEPVKAAEEQVLSDEQFIRELLVQSDKFQSLLKNCDMDSYVARWSELIEETCMDYASDGRVAGVQKSASLISLAADMAIDSEAPQHKYHSPSLGAMARSIAAAKRRLQLAQHTQSAQIEKVNAWIHTGECSKDDEDSSSKEDAAQEKHRRFKARVAKFLEEVGGQVAAIKQQAQQKPTVPQAARVQEDEVPRTMTLRELIGELHSMQVTQTVNEDMEMCSARTSLLTTPFSSRLETPQRSSRSSNVRSLSPQKSALATRRNVHMPAIRRCKSVERSGSVGSEAAGG